MKIFFIASIAGKSQFLNNYQRIIDILKNLGNKVYSDHVIKDMCDMRDLKLKKEYRGYSKRIYKLINESDAVVAEITYPSIMVGYLLNYSLRQRKYTLGLYQKNPHRILIGEASKFLRLKKYAINQNKRLNTIVNAFLEDIKKDSLHIRFNLMLDETTDRTLEKQSRKVKISKADYIRRLIEENVENGLG